MYATDFKYDGRYLSDLGFIICNFSNSKTAKTIKQDSGLSYDTVFTNRGVKHSLVSTKYQKCINAEFDICKDPDVYDDLKITSSEFREISRWLNRDGFYKFEFTNEDEADDKKYYYEASFNLSKIKLNETLYGIHLEMSTSSPFAFAEEEIVKFDLTSDNNYTKLILNKSDEIGYLYPTMTIVCKGLPDVADDALIDLEISNEFNGKTANRMCFSKCKVGEEIIIDGKTLTIRSSIAEHDINNNFNYNFLKLFNKLSDRRNIIKSNADCSIELRYTPLIKNSP